MPVAHSQIEEPTAAEIDAAMQEIHRAERERIFRDMVNEGACGFCSKKTLRLILTGGRMALACPCQFLSPRPSS
jgi:hypothetical protein